MMWVFGRRRLGAGTDATPHPFYRMRTWQSLGCMLPGFPPSLVRGVGAALGFVVVLRHPMSSNLFTLGFGTRPFRLAGFRSQNSAGDLWPVLIHSGNAYSAASRYR